MPRLLSSAPLLALAAGLALGLAACGPEPQREAPPRSAAPTTQPGPTAEPRGRARVNPHEPVTVALLAPLSGGNAAEVGNAIANAAQMAMTDMGDESLRLSVHDTRGTEEGAREAAQAALDEGAALFLGPLFAANAPAVGEVARGAGINAIAFSNDSSAAGGPVFVSGFLPEAEAARIVGFAAARGHDRLAVFHPDNGYGRAALRGAEQAAPSAGARVVTASSYTPTFQGIQDASGPFSGAAQSAGANAVLIPDSDENLGSAAAFLDYGGLDPARVKYLGLGQWQGPMALREAALRGGWFAAADPDRVARFSEIYAARHGARPPFLAVLGYDAVQAAGQLLTEARATRSETPFGRAELARSQGFQGALGPFSFRSDGTSRRALAVLEVGEGGFRVIDPAPARLDLML